MTPIFLLTIALVGLAAAVTGAVLAAPHLRRYPATAGYLLAWTISVGLVSLVLAASALGQLGDGPSVRVALILINLVVQPPCLLLFAGSVQKLGMALAGRVTYAGRTISSEGCPPEQYRSLLRRCVIDGVGGGALAGVLAYACLCPLL